MQSLLPRKPSWFWIAIVSLFIGSAILRFWQLQQFNELVFDENFFAKFANYYLNKKPFLDGHPPLGKYFIVLGIWLSRLNPWGYEVYTHVDYDIYAKVGNVNFHLPTVSYRWMNALVGSFIPLLVAGIAYQLNHRRRYALIAGGLAAMDGLLLVESRYALLNVYLVFFGLLGHLCFLIAISQQQEKKIERWLLFAGLSLGACISVKWNGLLFIFGLYTLWGLAQAINLLSHRFIPESDLLFAHFKSENSLLPNIFRKLHWRDLLFYLGIVPIFVYIFVCIPHLRLNREYNILTYQKQLLNWHLSIKGNAHAACSSWSTWPWTYRPVAFFYDSVEATSTVAKDTTATIYHYVVGMGNPFLWGLAVFALVILLGTTIQSFRSSIAQIKPPSSTSEPHSPELIGLNWVSVSATAYIVLNYSLSWLPWALVSRCSFLYHYMAASIFSFLALGWIVDRWIRSKSDWKQIIAWIAMLLVVFGFMYWLPFYMGSPLTEDGLHGRLWFKSWRWY